MPQKGTEKGAPRKMWSAGTSRPAVDVLSRDRAVWNSERAYCSRNKHLSQTRNLSRAADLCEEGPDWQVPAARWHGQSIFNSRHMDGLSSDDACIGVLSIDLKHGQRSPLSHL